jgi:integrase
LTGVVVDQPIAEFNRPSKADYGVANVPPADDEVEVLFTAWRDSLEHTRKFLTGARDYLAAWLWRRAGLRIQETYMLDMRDWRRDLGDYGKLHIRFGKGSRGRGPKTRLVPAINSVAEVLDRRHRALHPRRCGAVPPRRALRPPGLATPRRAFPGPLSLRQISSPKAVRSSYPIS